MKRLPVLFSFLILLISACSETSSPPPAPGPNPDTAPSPDPEPSPTPQDPLAPTARLLILPSDSRPVPVELTLDASASTGEIDLYEWFVDGELIGSDRRISYELLQPGEYKITLTVTGSAGKDTASASYTAVSMPEHLDVDHVLLPEDFDGYQTTLTAGQEWSLENNHAWLSVYPDRGGPGEHQVAFTVDVQEVVQEWFRQRFEDDNRDPLTGTIILHDGTTRTELNVTALFPLLSAGIQDAIPTEELNHNAPAILTPIELHNLGAHPLRVDLQLVNAPSPELLKVELPANFTIIPDGHSFPRVTVTCLAQGRTFNLEFHMVTDDIRPSHQELTRDLEIVCRDERDFGDYTIELVFQEGAFTEEQKRMMRAGADRWQQVIVSEIPDLYIDTSSNWCLERLGPTPGVVAPELSHVTHVDDLLVYVFPSAEGMGESTLARAGPCISGHRHLPNLGQVMINPAKLDAMTRGNFLTDTFIHELGHVLGIGTLWDEHLMGRGEYCGDQNVQNYFIGARATQAYREYGGAFEPPTDVGCSHWHEAEFQDEIMTPTVTIYADGTAEIQPLSKLTVGALGDLGYVVNRDASDPYRLSGASPRALGMGTTFKHGDPFVLRAGD